jgi:hypothetical protein
VILRPGGHHQNLQSTHSICRLKGQIMGRMLHWRLPWQQAMTWTYRHGNQRVVTTNVFLRCNLNFQLQMNLHVWHEIVKYSLFFPTDGSYASTRDFDWQAFLLFLCLQANGEKILKFQFVSHQTSWFKFVTIKPSYFEDHQMFFPNCTV